MPQGRERNRAEVPPDAPQPEQAGTPEEFTAALRALRIWSGLTYRRPEGKSTASGDAMPVSTIATTLGRNTLPSEPFVAVFTHAYGLDEADIERWRDARRRLALGQGRPVPYSGATPSDSGVDAAPVSADGPDNPYPGRRRHLLHLLAAALIGAGAALGGHALLSGLAGKPNSPRAHRAHRARRQYRRKPGRRPARRPGPAAPSGRGDQTGTQHRFGGSPLRARLAAARDHAPARSRGRAAAPARLQPQTTATPLYERIENSLTGLTPRGEPVTITLDDGTAPASNVPATENSTPADGEPASLATPPARGEQDTDTGETTVPTAP